jgi:hypothetical protein
LFLQGAMEEDKEGRTVRNGGGGGR